MNRPGELREQDLQQYEFGPTQAPERVLGVDERDKMLVAVTAMLGPIGVAASPESTAPFRPVLEARRPATVAEVANTVEFIPPVEAQYPEWRDEAKGHVATAAVMFASERPDLEVADDQYALAA